MTSLQQTTDVVKAAVASTTTCTPATVVTLKRLLLVDSDPVGIPTKPASRAAKSSTTLRVKSTNAPKKVSAGDEQLNSRDRALLATHVINATLKALAEASKPVPPSTPRAASDFPLQSATKRTLRRSASAPLSPLQPRTLNRIATAPQTFKINAKPTPPAQSTGCLAAVESARVAFTCLGSAKNPRDGRYDFQVESGMSAFISRLLALKLHDQALKEMKLLKRRLESLDNAELPQASKSNCAASTALTAAMVADLLAFKSETSNTTLPIITALQAQVLKLVGATKKPAHIEVLIPALRETNPSGPLTLLSKLAEYGDKEKQKSSRQLAAISQTLLSMLPSISAQGDVEALEPRLSPSPVSVFELQCLALRVQLKWWELAGHEGSIDDDVLGPFGRCARAFARRYKSDDKLLYHNIAAEFESLMHILRSRNYTPSDSSKSPLSSIYKVLGSTAHAARQYEGACCWFESLKASLCGEPEFAVQACSVSARILAAGLKKTVLDSDVERSIEEVIGSLGVSLSGTISELNELLESLSAVRRSVAGLLMKDLDPKNATSALPRATIDLLKKFTLQYPRFIRRWMGTAPGKDATAKQKIHFDQRKHSILQSINQTLDATLMVVRCELQSNSTEWQQLDDVLQHCISLLDSLTDPSTPQARADQFGSYHVKISTLYFSKFVELRQMPNRSKDLNKLLLQSLSRSIDAVKQRGAADQEKAQLSMKLEFFADLCKNAGRSEDAIGTLRSICTTMAEDGVLSDVAVALATLPPALAWSATEKASSLSRTLRSIAKLDKSWIDWTFFLPEPERAAVLEHLMHLSSSPAGQILRLHDPSPAALLRIYTADKYPVRRFRVLLHLLYQNIGEEKEAAEIVACLDQLLEQLQNRERGEDGSLSHFVPHLRAYHFSITALVKLGDSFPASAINHSVSSWRTMVDSSTSKDDLYARIDDPDTMIEFLYALNSFAELCGEAQIQVAISELSITLCQAASMHHGSSQDRLIQITIQLAAQYVNMGKFAAAAGVLDRSRDLVKQNDRLPEGVVADFHLSRAEYDAGIGRLPDSLTSLGRVREICQASRSTWAESKAQASLKLSRLDLVQSVISLQLGDVETALVAVKASVRTLSRDWTKLETQAAQSEANSSDTSIPTVAGNEPTETVTGPRFWSLAAPLLRCLLHISFVYAHVGMYQETLYYAESARKIAESTRSSLYRTHVASWVSSIFFKAGQLSKALETMEAAKNYMPGDVCSARVHFARKLGELYLENGDEENAGKYLDIAEETLLMLDGPASGCEAPGRPRKAPPSKARTISTRQPRARPGATKHSATSAETGPTKRPPPAGAKLPAKAVMPTVLKDIYQSSLLAAVHLSRALGHVQRKKWSQALCLLEQVKELPKLLSTLSLEQVITATTLIGHGMEQMISDPVFSVIQDSTISFPAVSAGSDRSMDKGNPAPSPPKRGRSATIRHARDKSAPAFAEALKQAQSILTGAHASALPSSDSGMVHRLSSLLQNTNILLSAATGPRTRITQSSAFAPVAVDVGRNITWLREQNILRSLTDTPATRSPASSSELSISTAHKPLEGVPLNMSSFNDMYVNLLPKQWSVISLSLSDDRHDLSITRLQNGHRPFVLRLPLERANCRDADSEVFNFEHGRDELLDIIRLANETSHSARDFSARGERNAWWAEREALDSRLRDLLSTVETTWLGGFKGIFSQHQYRPELLARFRKSFQQMLDSSLPSRTRTRGKRATKSEPVTLDSRVLELFIALGDPVDPDSDYDEALNDLLYFVVDILQFHGERNAYDEIDFEAMMVETYDAIRGYYSAARSVQEGESGAHTILVLDKALHAFPWESLPCMQGLAVSRVPSLACLQQLLTQSSTASGSGETAPGHKVSRQGGTYMLNPSSDLKNTQDFFQSSFESLKDWKGIVNKAPHESEFEEALAQSEILLYFGHGSGAQYIRGRTVRRLDKCKAATFLMGCSSASLNEAGEFECYGPVWNYMLAGCPAVVGTLWDVTDRDIDRFAGRAFEEWGLFPRGTFAEQDRKGNRVTANGKDRRQGSAASGQGKASGSSSSDEDDSTSRWGGLPLSSSLSSSSSQTFSLPEAVAKARDACKFRHLNAAAVVVYGIPVYIREGE